MSDLEWTEHLVRLTRYEWIALQMSLVGFNESIEQVREKLLQNDIEYSINKM